MAEHRVLTRSHLPPGQVLVLGHIFPTLEGRGGLEGKDAVLTG